MAEFGYEDRTRTPNGTSGDGSARDQASAALDTAGSAVRDTAGTAKEQAGQVAGEAKAQVRGLARDARDRVGAEARTQNDRLADGVRRFADELDEMVGQRGDSPASKVVTQVSQGGRRVADYLAEHGPEGVLDGVQDFARRRPGTFLLAAVAAGFVAGRLGKGVFSAGSAEHEPTGTQPVMAASTPVQSVPVQPVPVQPSAGVSGTYAGSSAAVAEPFPAPVGVRP